MSTWLSRRSAFAALGFSGLAALVACGGTESAASTSDVTGAREAFAEFVRPGEEAEFRRFMGEMNDLQKRIASESGHVIARGFHAKAHACVGGELRVLADRDERARFGVFANEGTFPAWVRFSNGSGVVQSDKQSDARGLAVKLVGVDGATLLDGDSEFPGDQGAATQDFLFTNKPRSTSRDSRGFMAFARAGLNVMLIQKAMKEHSAGDALDAVPGIASAFDDFLSSGVEDLPRLDLVGRGRVRLENAKMLREILSRTKRRVDSMAQETFWSGSAFKLGPRAVKYQFRPCEELHKPVRPDNAPDDYLATELANHLKANTTCYDLYVQFQLASDKQPIEDAFKLWDERESPPLRIAQLVIPPTDLADAATRAQTEYCSHLAFTPWHGLTEHRPLGNINRARKFVLKASQNLRHAEDEILDEANVRAPKASRAAGAPSSSGTSPRTEVGPCPINEAVAACDECVRALCTPDARKRACARPDTDPECATLVESLCKTCEE